MSGSQFLDAMEYIDPVYIEEAEEEPNRRRKTWLMRSALAACFALIVCFAYSGIDRSPVPVIPITQSRIAAEPPGGISRYLNYGGCRYRFIENGSSFALGEGALAEPLGTLEYDVASDPGAYGSVDFASTFAQGGTIYRMSAYDPAFRVAVELNGNYYICESTGPVDGSDWSVADYFAAADFQNIVTEISIYDHFGQEELARLHGKDVEQMLGVLTEVTPADLSDDDYSKIGRAQISGESFLVVFQLADTTRYQLYVIPSMSIAMINNDRFLLTDAFHSAFDATFAALKPADVAPQS